MPGYGYARVSRATRAAWGRLIETYLRERPNLRAIVQIVDFRHLPSPDDQQMWEWLRHFDKPRLLVATKVDKIGRSHWHTRQRAIAQALELGPGEEMVLFSAETGHGRDDVWRWIHAMVTRPVALHNDDLPGSSHRHKG